MFAGICNTYEIVIAVMWFLAIGLGTFFSSYILIERLHTKEVSKDYGK